MVGRGLSYAYGRGRKAISVLDGLDIEIPSAGYVALLGRSGAGKSTLLSLVGGLDVPQQGVLRVGTVNVSELRGRRLAAFRRETVGFIFQHFGLVDVLTARQNVELATALARMPRRLRASRVEAVLEAVGLSERAGHPPSALSGGERQRVAIARALVNRPRLLLADEPTGNLDRQTAERVLHLIEALRVESGCTLVVVTHNSEIASRADAQLHLVEGRLDEYREGLRG